MKTFLIIFLLPVLLVTSCVTQEQSSDTGTDTTGKSADTVITPLPPGPLSGTLHNYYQLKDAFVRTDGTGADLAAIQLRLNIDSLNAGKLNADTLINDSISHYKKNMLSAIDSLIKVRIMSQKRQQFQTLSTDLYHLVKTIPYPGENIYRLHCTQALTNGANWLSSAALASGNPYDAKLPECGVVTDSITR